MPALFGLGGSIEMHLVGYAYPHAHDPDDWMGIRIIVQCGDVRWDFIEDCLTKQEVHELCQWLNSVAARDYSRRAFWTTDDQPAFELSEDRTALCVSVRVSDGDEPGVHWVDFSFSLDRIDVQRFANEWCGEAARFPEP